MIKPVYATLILHPISIGLKGTKNPLSAKQTIMYLRSMYLYNVTIIAENEIGKDVHNYLRGELLSEGLSFLEMLDSPHEGITYCVQMRTESRDEIATFQSGPFSVARTYLETMFPGKVLFFDSIMKYLHP